MIAQKELFIPTVDTVPVTDYDASSDFTTDYIEFPNSIKDWSLQTVFDSLAGGPPELTILVSNDEVNYVPYKPSVVSMDMTIIDNLIIYDMIMPARYMKLQYVSNGATGLISFIITK